MFNLSPLVLGPVVFQKRGQVGNPSTYFAKTWTEYKIGFHSKGELWLGLDEISALTSTGTWRLDVVMGDWDGQTYTANYNKFSVGLEATGYRLTIGSFNASGASTLGDSMAHDNGMKFSTKDVDNDLRSSLSCSSVRGYGGWWFAGCGMSSPNGKNDQNAKWAGIAWKFGGNRGNSWKSWKSSKFVMTQQIG